MPVQNILKRFRFYHPVTFNPSPSGSVVIDEGDVSSAASFTNLIVKGTASLGFNFNAASPEPVVWFEIFGMLQIQADGTAYLFVV